MPSTPRTTPAPLIAIPRTITLMPAAFTLMPLTPFTRIEPKVPVQSSVIDLVIVTVPKPPGSRQSISPPAAVLEIAPANVLHGAVRLQGFTSSPTPDTQVRVACAWAGVTDKPQPSAAAAISTNASNDRRIATPFVRHCPDCEIVA